MRVLLLLALLPGIALAQSTRILGKGAGAYAPNQPEDVCAAGQFCPPAIDPDGRIITSSQITTDEGGLFENFTGAALDAGTWTSATGTGASIAVANSRLTITAGTTASAVTYISAPVDYGPLRTVWRVSLSTRTANQDIYLQLGNNANPTLATQFVRWHFTGTTNTLVRCETQSSADTNGSEGTGSDITLPYGANTSTMADYTLSLSQLRLSCSYGLDTLESAVIAQYAGQVPHAYTEMYVSVLVVNGGSSPSANTVTVDFIRIKNDNRLEISGNYTSEPAATLMESDVVADGAALTTSIVGAPHNLHQDTQGRLLVRTDHPYKFNCIASALSAVGNCTGSASGTGLYYYITDVTISSSTAQTVQIVSDVDSGCAAGVTNLTAAHYLPANGGYSKTFATPIKAGGANHFLCCKPGTGAAVSCDIQGFIAP